MIFKPGRVPPVSGKQEQIAHLLPDVPKLWYISEGHESNFVQIAQAAGNRSKYREYCVAYYLLAHPDFYGYYPSEIVLDTPFINFEEYSDNLSGPIEMLFEFGKHLFTGTGAIDFGFMMNRLDSNYYRLLLQMIEIKRNFNTTGTIVIK